MSLKRIVRHPVVLMLIVVLFFVLALASLFPIRIQQMGSGEFFVLNVIPFPYWVGLIIVASATFFMLRFAADSHFRVLVVLSSVVLMVAFRMAFPVVFTSIPAYEPDALNYLTVVNSWVKSGVDFGVEGNYQHNFPFCFLVAYMFVKLGVSLDLFFRIAPFVIYSFVILILYLLIREVSPESKKLGATSAFLFSFSSLGYWVTVHYCPDLIGVLFYFVSLYLCLRFAKKGEWKVKTLLPVCASIFVLILSHHLSTLYLIVTLLGFSLSTWFFKPRQIRGGALSFFVLGIFTYTLWFAYGILVYPSFFNFYIYFSGISSLTSQSQAAGLINNAAFAIYPIFIFSLFAYAFLKTLQIKRPIKRPINTLKLRTKLKEVRNIGSDNMLLVFSVGFGLMVLLFIAGFAAPATQATRVLEVLSIAMLPFSSQTFMDFAVNQGSKRKILFLLLITLVVVVTGAYRYYSQIQRRVLLSQ